jgi:hypothetical protein
MQLVPITTTQATRPACRRPLSPSQRAARAAELADGLSPYATILCVGWDGRDRAALLAAILAEPAVFTDRTPGEVFSSC